MKTFTIAALAAAVSADVWTVQESTPAIALTKQNGGDVIQSGTIMETKSTNEAGDEQIHLWVHFTVKDNGFWSEYQQSYLQYEEEPGVYGGFTCTVKREKVDGYAQNPIIKSYSGSGRFNNDNDLPKLKGTFSNLEGTTVDPSDPWKPDTNPDTMQTTYKSTKSGDKIQACGAYKNIYTYGVKNEAYWQMKEAGSMDMLTGVRLYRDENTNPAGVDVYVLATPYALQSADLWDVKPWVDPNPPSNGGDNTNGGGQNGAGGDGGDGTKAATDGTAGTGDVGTCGGAAALLSAATAIAAMMAF